MLPTTTLTVRRADLSDLAAVIHLRAEAIVWLASQGLDQWQPGQPGLWTPDGVRRSIERGTCYVAEEAGEVVGTITIDDRADPEFWTEAERAEPALYLHRMVVTRRRAGQGVGQALVDFAEELAMRSGVGWLRLDAWKDNVKLHAYYAGQGFHHVRTVDLPHRGSGALFQRPVRPRTQ